MPRPLLLLFCMLTMVRAEAGIHALNQLDNIEPGQFTLIDARDLEQCSSASLAGARCLPASTFIAADDSVASFYHIGWALGTHGLQADENILVFADSEADRNILAGVLHLSGQKNVWVWQGDISRLRQIFETAPGQIRALTRQQVYQGVVRETSLALVSEIGQLEASGWRMFESSAPPPAGSRVIVAGTNPAKSVDTFVRLLLENRFLPKLVVDSFPARHHDTADRFQLTGVLVILAAIGLMAVAFSFNRGSR